MDEERFSVFLEAFGNPFPKEILDLEKKALSDNIPIIRRDTQRYIRFLLAERKPEKILEIGTAVGFSAIFMAYYSDEDTRIITFESSKKRYDMAVENLKEFNSEKPVTNKIEAVFGDASDFIKDDPAYAVKEGYDLCFLDAAKGQYPELFKSIKPLIKQGGMIITDNILQNGDTLESRFMVERRDRTIHKRMREFLFSVSRDPDLTSDILPIGDGLLVCVKNV